MRIGCLHTFALVSRISFAKLRALELGREEKEKEAPIVEYLVHLLQHFRGLRWLRYHTIHPKCLDGSWPNWTVSSEDDLHLGEIRVLPVASEEHSWAGIQMDNKRIFRRIIDAIHEADIWLQGFEMPLIGNRASYGAVASNAVVLNFGATLTYLSMSITDMYEGELRFWVGYLDCLEVLDLSFSTLMDRRLMWQGFRPWQNPPFRLMDPVPNLEDVQLLTLKELRLSADNRYVFTASDINKFLSCFPNLSKLGFAHIQLAYSTWGEILESLATLNVETLWLMNPRNVVIPPAIPGQRRALWSAVEYQEDQYLSGAAKEVKLMHAESPPIGADGVPERRLDFEYPGFAIFDRLA